METDLSNHLAHKFYKLKNKDERYLNCPKWQSEDHPCCNHIMESILYKSNSDDYKAHHITTIDADGSVRTSNNANIETPHRCREMSRVTTFCCEFHGTWIQYEMFHKGSIYLRTQHTGEELR